MGIRLSVIVKIHSRSADPAGSACRTIRSVSEHYKGNSSDIRFIIVPAGKNEDIDTPDRLFAGISKAAGDLYDIVYTGRDGLNDAVSGEYVLILEQGTVVSEGDLACALDVFDHTDSVVFRLTGEDHGNGLKQSGFLSVFTDTGAIGQDPDNIIIKHASGCDLSALADSGIYAESLVAKMIVDGEGVFYYGRIKVKQKRTDEESDAGDVGAVAADLISHSLTRYGYVCEYIQRYILRLLSAAMSEHAHVEEPEKLLGKISDDVIAECRDIDVHQKIYLFSIKYSTDAKDELSVSDEGILLFRGISLGKINTVIHLSVSIVRIEEACLVLEGTTDIPFLIGSHYSLCASDKDDDRAAVEISPLRINDSYGFDNDKYNEGEQFIIRLPIGRPNTFSMYLESDDGRIIPLYPHMSRFSRLNYKLGMSYFREQGRLVKFDHGLIKITAYSRKQHMRYEMSYLRELISKRKMSCVFYRLLYYVDRFFKRKPVWLVMDRPHLAGDNGEHLFRYLQQTDAVKKNDVYFVLKKTSKDYDRIRKIGRVIIHNSLKYKIKTLDSDLLIAAAANELTTNAFGNSGVYYRDLCTFDFVYLRHGMSHNDQSEWLHRLRKNIRILVSSCREEYEGILSGDYGYTEHEVKLTGLARYDGLYDNKKKVIAIMPTWRQNLEGESLYRSSRRAYIRDFKDTDYYRFYTDLINNSELLDVMRESGYTGVLYMHPVFEAQYKDFKGNDVISVGKGAADYQKVFRDSAVMVTDYSSVAFDFAYLRKPVVYSQFDEESFYKNHVWNEGYFSYREDGFGPVTNTVEETVDTLIHYIRTGCEMEPVYRDRADGFFAYNDRNNCERIYKAVCEAAEERRGR